MLNWTVTRHTVLPPGSTLFRVDIEVDGRLLATGQGNNKADATEEASKTAFLELHGLEMYSSFTSFLYTVI